MFGFQNTYRETNVSRYVVLTLNNEFMNACVQHASFD